MKRILMILTILLTCSGIIGCAANPKAKYLTNPTGDDASNPSFYLSGSIINLIIPPETKKDDTSTKGYELSTQKPCPDVDHLKEAKVKVTQTAVKNNLYYIKPQENIFVKPNFAVTYYDNTKIIKIIGTDIKDERKEIISTVGGIITAGIGILAPLSPTPIPKGENLELPLALDISTYDFKDTGWKTIPGYKSWKYRILVKEDGKQNYFAPEDFFSKAKESYVRSFPYSTCQDIQFDVCKEDGVVHCDSKTGAASIASFNITVANPNKLELMNFPRKGSITMHSVCGADIKSENADISSNLEILDAIFQQAEAIKKKYDESKDDDSDDDNS